MQSSQDCMCDDIPDALDRAPVRCILAEQNMRTPSIVISGEFRKDPPQVLFVELCVPNIRFGMDAENRRGKLAT
jgi:hypothetical protein